MESKKVVILGSSRKAGDTEKVVRELISYSGWDLIDLNDYQFSYYDYENKNSGDDYIELMRSIIEKYDVLIFATPVYWYSMSGIMKVFFDRITDLLEFEKELGRQLRGKYMAALSCSNGSNLGEHFWLPFSESAQYLGMKYLGSVHTLAGRNESIRIKEFIEKVNKNSPQARKL